MGVKRYKKTYNPRYRRYFLAGRATKSIYNPRGTAPYNTHYLVKTIPRGVRSGFPKMFKMKHKYCEAGTITSSVGALQSKIMSCNGMYDPNISGGGHQPYYFDQMSALYNHYTVIGSKINLAISPVTASEEPFFVCLWINDDTTVTPTNLSTLQEINTGRYRMVALTANRTSYLSHKWSMKKNWGKEGSLANSLLRGDASNNPTEQQYYNITVQACDQASTVNPMVQIEITYIAVWNELKDIAGS